MACIALWWSRLLEWALVNRVKRRRAIRYFWLNDSIWDVQTFSQSGLPHTAFGFADIIVAGEYRVSL